MVRPRGLRLVQGFTAALVSLSICLLAVEAGLRGLWTNAPDGIFPSDTGCCQGGRLRPAVDGHDRFHRFHHNSRGYRGGELAPGRGTGPRVALLGDSFVYGVGVGDDETIPALVGQALGVEAINAGVPGSDMESGLARVSRLAADYRPDVVAFVLLYNDLDVVGPGSPVGAPVRAVPVQEGATRDLRGRIGHAMLPIVDPGLGRAAVVDPSIERRYALARRWRTWLYVGLELQRVGTQYPRDERRLGLMHLEGERMEELAWARARRGLAALAEAGRREGFQPAVVIFDHGPLEGIPAMRLRALLGESGLPWLDLAPAWGSYEEYVRDWSFRFDLHPNPRANAEAALGIAALVAPLLPGGRRTAAQQAWWEAHEARTVDWLKRQETKAEEQRALRRSLEASFRSRVGGEENEAEREAVADQWRHGWWLGLPPAGPGEALLGAEADLALMAPPGGGHRLVLDVRPLHDAPLRLTARCGTQEGRANPDEVVKQGEDSPWTFHFEPPLPAGEVQECRIGVIGEIPDLRPSPGAPQPPRAAFLVHRVQLSSEVP